MNYNKTKMPSQSESDLMKNNPLAESIELIRTYAFLEEDEDTMPVAQREIERAITTIEAVYARLKLVPFFVVPTRSGGVGVEYRIRGADAYYHFDPNGRMDFVAAKGDEMIKQLFFENLDEAPNLLSVI